MGLATAVLVFRTIIQPRNKDWAAKLAWASGLFVHASDI